MDNDPLDKALALLLKVLTWFIFIGGVGLVVLIIKKLFS